jgi:hypothetical protein
MRLATFVGILSLAVCACAGCASVTVQPGHRALLFDPDRGGMQREVLGPGVYRLGGGHVDDFSILYAQRRIDFDVPGPEGAVVHAQIAVVYRPIVAELYQLDTEEGTAYFDDVVGPAILSSSRAALEQALFDGDATPPLRTIEAAMETAARQRTEGKHVEIAYVLLQRLDVARRPCAAAD